LPVGPEGASHKRGLTPFSPRKLVLAGAACRKFDSASRMADSRPWFHPKDREIALEIDRADFAIRVTPREGLLIAGPVSV